MKSHVLALIVCAALLLAAWPALAFEGAGGDVISVSVSPVDSAVAAVNADTFLQYSTEAVRAEAVTFVAVLESIERGGVVLYGCTLSVGFSGVPSTYSVLDYSSGAPLHHWYMG